MPTKKTSLVHSALGKITSDPGAVVIPRSEVLFFVKEAAAVGEWDLAEKLLSQCLERYPSSRVVKTAQDYLQERRTEIENVR